MRTEEQQSIIDAIVIKKEPLVKVLARAGVGKSHVSIDLVAELLKTNPDAKVRYCVYGNANAAEMTAKFGHTAIVSTLHALAYHYIIRQKRYNLNKKLNQFISWKHIPKTITIPFGKAPLVIELVNMFCKGTINTYNEFADSLVTDKPIPQSIHKNAKDVLLAMQQGKMEITHDFYLKLFHRDVMQGKIQLDQPDLLIADEFQDANPQLLDIFKAYPAKQKLMLGDDLQSCFRFMGCVNAFKELDAEGTTLPMTKTFRCNTLLAKKVETFMQKTVEPEMHFEGIDYPEDFKIESRAYITRTNMELVAYMIKADVNDTPYRLISKAKTDQLFKYPLFLLGAKPGTKYYDPNLKSLQLDVEAYHKSPTLQKKYSSTRSYLLNQNPDDSDLKAASQLLGTYKPEEVITAYNNVEKHRHSQGVQVLTCHTSKGFSFDSVELSKKMESSIKKAMLAIALKEELTDDEYDSILLYYIAVTRCRVELIGAYTLENIYNSVKENT